MSTAAGVAVTADGLRVLAKTSCHRTRPDAEALERAKEIPRGGLAMRQVMNEIRLPSHDEPISAVTILDGQDRVVRVVPAAQFRSGPIVRRHPIVSRGNRRGIRAAMPDSVAVLQAVATITRGRKPNVRERQTNSSV